MTPFVQVGVINYLFLVFSFPGSLDKYEVGDLSGRYGNLVKKDVFDLNSQDANLPLYGLHTILGRSIVLHEVSGARFVCADIEPEHKLKVSALANFTAMKDSPLRGFVHLVSNHFILSLF